MYFSLYFSCLLTVFYFPCWTAVKYEYLFKINKWSIYVSKIKMTIVPLKIHDFPSRHGKTWKAVYVQGENHTFGGQQNQLNHQLVLHAKHLTRTYLDRVESLAKKSRGAGRCFKSNPRLPEIATESDVWQSQAGERRVTTWKFHSRQLSRLDLWPPRWNKVPLSTSDGTN